MKRYFMKSRILSDAEQDQPLATLNGNFWGPEVKIQLCGEMTQFSAGILESAKPDFEEERKYWFRDEEGQILWEGTPLCAEEGEPESQEWPANRIPRVDRVRIEGGGERYLLLMKNSQNFRLEDPDGEVVLQILHRGISGGWDIETEREWSAGWICGIFLFGRYLEKENEFSVI